MDNLRKQIDQIDEQLMTLINERYKLTKLIGEYKQKHNLPVTSQKREEEVLSKIDKYLYSSEIKTLYQTMFEQNKVYQGFTYGLIGKSLPYTLSPMLYQLMGIDSYGVIETDDYKKVMQKINFKGINITIPYKSEAYEYCKDLDESAKVTKAVNTIIGSKGYNTDYLALVELFKSLKLQGHQVTIIGNGATARSIAMALGNKVHFLVRTKRHDDEYLLKEYEKLQDTEYLINATPYGTYPNITSNPLFPLANFKKLKMVIDVIYNPLNSPLILEAKKFNIPSINGLDLLVKQASINYKLFTGKEVNDEALLQVVKRKLYNIVLVGLSYSGKSTIGKMLAQKLNKKFVDTDDILFREHHDLPTILNNGGSIDDYREHENKLANQIGLKFNQVIATGGGMILSASTMQALAYNSIIIHLNPSLKTLKKRFDGTRALLKEANDLDKMYDERMPLYEKYRMMTFTEDATIEEMVEKIYAYLNH
jgi:shikimate dehydrogenase